VGTRYRGDARQVRALDAFIKLMRAASAVTAAVSGPMRSAGLTESQFGVLEALLHVGPMCQKDLAAKLLKSPGNLTTVVSNLERDGLVQRRAHAGDRRRVEVHLTPRGRRLISELFPAHADHVCRAMTELTAGEQDELGRLCRILGTAAAGRGRG
jgi:MarR family 2-MHQ and catechol resistance regulon transcriptional repressor